MPTPFMHLEVAERILADSRTNQSVKDLIMENTSPYYLGHVAPDFQWLCNIPREETHFYPLPPAKGDPAYPTMFARYPDLVPSANQPPSKVVFVTAYATHLKLDTCWFHEILMRYFQAGPQWSSHHERYLVHNILLTYLDKLAFSSLPTTAGKTLAGAEPDHWLPFAKDDDLLRWRDYLVVQMDPGATLKTGEIYAERLLMSPEQFYANLNEPLWMDEHLFSKVPVDEVRGIIDSAVSDSINIVNSLIGNLQ